MSPEEPAIMERLLRDNHLGWMIDLQGPPGSIVAALIDQLSKLTIEFRKRFRGNFSFAPEALLAESERNPQKIRAFLQAFGTTGNQEMQH